MAARAPVDHSSEFQLDEGPTGTGAVCADVDLNAGPRRRRGPAAERYSSGKAGRPRMAASPATHPASAPDSEPLDQHKVAQRQKQLDFGKNTIGYQRYLKLVPRHVRGKDDPKTPEIHAPLGKRQFDGQVKAWRRQLHKFDDLAEVADEPAEERDGEAGLTPTREGQQGQGEREGSPDISRGSLDAYMDPALRGGARKRDFAGAFPGATAAGPGAAVAGGAPEPKRSTASRGAFMQVDGRSGGGSLPQASTAATGPGPAAPPGAPTTFAGLGLGLGLGLVVQGGAGGNLYNSPCKAAPTSFVGVATKLQHTPSGDAPTTFTGMGLGGGAEEGVQGTPAAAAEVTVVLPTAAGVPKADRSDNVIAMILGDDTSCMSWQS